MTSMAKKKLGANPFYVVLLLVGVVFVVTACAYCVMAFTGAKGVKVSESGSQLLVFLDRRGGLLLGVEVLVLAVASFAAMATDSFWSRRAEHRQKNSPDETDESRSGP